MVQARENRMAGEQVQTPKPTLQVGFGILATGKGETLKTTEFGSLFKQENGLLGLSERAP
jgi:hypothetical protein